MSTSQNRYGINVTKEDFKKALSQKNLLKDLEWQQLELLFNQPDCKATPTNLAALMGEKSHQGVSARNVAIAKKIAKFLKVDPSKRSDGSYRWWAFLVYAEKKGRYWEFELRRELTQAIRELKIFKSKANDLPSLAEFLDDFESSVRESKNFSTEKRRERLQKSDKVPKSKDAIISTFIRNPDVVAEVLDRANGVCEKCSKEAPFFRATDNTPYLEVHHKKQLSKGGEDTIENAIALCPNCHREEHFGRKP